MVTISLLMLINIYEINKPRQEEAGHARNLANTSNLEDGETSAVQQPVKAKWTVEIHCLTRVKKRS